MSSGEFLAEFENVAAYFTIEDKIELEEGRPFSYKCAKIFTSCFNEFSIDPISKEVFDSNNIQSNNLVTRNIGFQHSIVKFTASTLSDRAFYFVEDLENKYFCSKISKADFMLRKSLAVISTTDSVQAKAYLKKLCENSDILLFDDALDAQNSLKSDFKEDADHNQVSSLISGVKSGIKFIGKWQLLEKLAQRGVNNREGGQTENLETEVKPPMLFKSYEFYAFFLLRYTRTRYLRRILLFQLNALRSIERDVTRILSRIPEVWCDLIDPLSSQDVFAQFNKRFDDAIIFEQRSVLDDRNVVSNEDGADIVYDITFKDLEKVEEELLTLGTMYIERGISSLQQRRKSGEKLDQSVNLRHKTPLEDDALSGDIMIHDRNQILYDLYEAEVALNTQKLSLINLILEIITMTTSAKFRRWACYYVLRLIRGGRFYDASKNYALDAVKVQERIYQIQELLFKEIFACTIEKDKALNRLDDKKTPLYFVSGHEKLRHIPSLLKCTRETFFCLRGSDLERFQCEVPLVLWQLAFEMWQQAGNAVPYQAALPHSQIFSETLFTSDKFLALNFDSNATFSSENKNSCSFLIGMKLYRKLYLYWTKSAIVSPIINNQHFKLVKASIGDKIGQKINAFHVIEINKGIISKASSSPKENLCDADALSLRSRRTLPLALESFDYDLASKLCLETPEAIEEMFASRHMGLEYGLMCQIIDFSVGALCTAHNSILINRLENSNDKSRGYLLQQSAWWPTKLQAEAYDAATIKFADLIRFSQLMQSSENGDDVCQMKYQALDVYKNEICASLELFGLRLDIILLASDLPSAFTMSRSPIFSTLSASTENSNNDSGQLYFSIEDKYHARLTAAPQQEDFIIHFSRTQGQSNSLALKGQCKSLTQLRSLYFFAKEIFRIARAMTDQAGERAETLFQHMVSTVIKDLQKLPNPLILEKIANYFVKTWANFRLRLQLIFTYASFASFSGTESSEKQIDFDSCLAFCKYAAAYGSKSFVGQKSAVMRASFDFRPPQLKEAKHYWEKYQEVESFLDTIYQIGLTDYESSEKILQLQFEYLTTILRLNELRFEYFSVKLKREQILCKNAAYLIKCYKNEVQTPSFWNHAHQVQTARQKGESVVQYSHRTRLSLERAISESLTEKLLCEYSSQAHSHITRVFNNLVDERTGSLFESKDIVSSPSTQFYRKHSIEFLEKNLIDKNQIFQESIAESRSRLLSAVEDLDNKEKALDVLSCLLEIFASKVAEWGQRELSEQKRQNFVTVGILLNTIEEQKKRITESQTKIDQFERMYEQNVRLAVASQMTELGLRLVGQEWKIEKLTSEKRVLEDEITARCKRENEEIVSELRFQIQKITSKFHHFRIRSAEEATQIINDAKLDALQCYTQKHGNDESKRSGCILSALSEDATRLRERVSNLEDVVVKLKVMSALRIRSCKSIAKRKISTLEEEKRRTEERLWEAYYESDSKEQTLRQDLNKAQALLVCLQAENERLKKKLTVETNLRLEQKKQLDTYLKEEWDALEQKCLSESGVICREEFKALMERNREIEREKNELEIENLRLKDIVHKKEWYYSLRNRMSPSRSDHKLPIQRS